MSINPAKCRVEIFHGPPAFFDDHFQKGWTNPSGTLDVSNGETAKLTRASGSAELQKTISFNTSTHRYLITRIVDQTAPGIRIFLTKASGGSESHDYTTDVGLNELDLQLVYTGAITAIDIAVLGGSDGLYVEFDYIAVTKTVTVIPTSTGDIVGPLTITRPVLKDGVAGAKLTVQNFSGEYNGDISEHDAIIIWLARDDANLGTTAYKRFGGRIVNPTNRGDGPGAHYIDLDCHGHAWELLIPPANLQKYYGTATNGRTIIEDNVALCAYISKHPTATKWFDNGGSSGSTDDRIDSTHDGTYDEVNPKTVIDEICDKAKNPAGAQGFDIIETAAGVLIGHLRESQDFNSAISSITPEEYAKSYDSHPIKNLVRVYGAKQKNNPSDKDGWTESTTGWTKHYGSQTLTADGTDKVRGSYSIKTTVAGASDNWIYKDLGLTIDATHWKKLAYKKLHFVIKWHIDDGGSPPAAVALGSAQVRLIDDSGGWNGNGYYQYITFQLVNKPDQWIEVILDLGETAEAPSGSLHGWLPTGSGYNWETIIKRIGFMLSPGPPSADLYMWVDEVYFSDARYTNYSEGTASEAIYGVRQPEPEVNDAFLSDSECEQRAGAVRGAYSYPITTLKDVKVDGDLFNPAERQKVIVTNDGLDAYFRISQVVDTLLGVDWTSTLTLSNDPMLAAYTRKGENLTPVFLDIKRQQNIDRRGV